MRIREERGWTMVVTMAVLALLLGTGLVALALADTQGKRAKQERNREVALNVAEGVLYGQAFILSLSSNTTVTPTPGWPSKVANAYPLCDQNSYSGTNAPVCPDDQMLTNHAGVPGGATLLRSVDLNSSTTWTSQIQDDGGGNATGCPTTNPAISSDYLCHSNTAWDANGNKKVWVRATATVRGRTRTVVGLMQLEALPFSLPRFAVVSGAVAINQNGNANPPLIDPGTSTVQIRCNTTGNTGVPTAGCANYSIGPQGPQIASAPTSIKDNYTQQAAISDPDLLASLKDTAITNQTYYAGCPPANAGPQGNKVDLSGSVVWVDNCNVQYGNGDLLATPCTYNSPTLGSESFQNCINRPPPKSGMLIWNKGHMEINANDAFFGVIYSPNQDNCGIESPPINDGATCPSDDVKVYVHGGATVVGAVNIDGGGIFSVGNTQYAFQYDPNVFNALATFGTTGLVQNSWRELKFGE